MWQPWTTKSKGKQNKTKKILPLTNFKLLNQTKGNSVNVHMTLIKAIILIGGNHCDYLSWVPKHFSVPPAVGT